MKIPGYNIDLEKAVKIIKENDYERVVLQVPEGLKSHYSKFVEFLEEKTSASIIISADPCFGACDIVSSEFKDLNADFMVQIGHTSIPNIKDFSIPTLFLNAISDIDVSKAIEKAIPSIKEKKIGLVSTAQHIHMLDNAGEILVKNGFEPIVGNGDDRIDSKGQILGCNFSAATSIADKVDAFLFIGSGNFHPLGLILSTKKPVIACDPYTNEVKEKELDDLKDIVLRQRYGAIARSKDAKTFGILVGTKKGQQRIDLAHEIQEKLDSKQKKSYIFTMNHFSPPILEGFRNIDCFVSTACPRIAIDDYMQYKIPILTPVELDILLGLKKWEDYQFDEIRN
ncbi:MAG: diphthamide biosynthesis enzyme Dph2 [Thermoplasmatales archaeon]|nr:diphthamide biosynthesis enzyme Dph2 [Thermoplasmatales archaeon]